MSTDMKLDQQGGDWLIIEGRVLKTTASDLIIDSPGRRLAGSNSSPHRRALVHDFQDGLTINFNGDYPGGVTVNGKLVVTGDLTVAGNLTVAGQALSETIADLHTVLGSIQRKTDRFEAIENSIASIVQLMGAVVIPPWRTKTEVEEGDEMGMSTKSAEQLGLIVQFQIDQLNPNFDHEEVISITPPAGTVVMPGTTVVVMINLQG